jgi:hypothetical protein
MKFLTILSLFSLFSNVVAATEYTVELEKKYFVAVSATQALADLEAEAKMKILTTCPEQKVYARKFIVNIPFDVSDFGFYPNGIPGSIENPVFINFSYPTVTATLQFVCNN